MSPTSPADATVVIFAKAPVAGRAKTRLTPPCSPTQAAALAAAALADTFTAVLATPRITPVLVLDGEPGPWIPAGVEIVPQPETDFNGRLRAAFTAAAGPIVLIGMDTPQLTGDRIRAVVDTLLRPGTDAVLGRTVDGGWWTLGLAQPADAVARGIFGAVPVSSSATGELQRRELDALGLATVEVEVETDVDTAADAVVVAELAPTTRFASTWRSVAATCEVQDAR